MSRLWIDTLIGINQGTGGTNFQTLMGGFTAPQTRLTGMTLLRTIIGLDVAYVVHDAGEGSQDVAIGIALGETDQIAAGFGSLPNPEVATDFPRLPWVWRARYRIFGFAADQPTVFTRRIDLDIRAQRKLENAIAYLITTNTAREGVASSVAVSGFVRQLWLSR